MVLHKCYRIIIGAVRKGRLKEPFKPKDIKIMCPNFNKNTASTFLPKHRKNNPSNNSELFIRVARGEYKLIKPVKYGI